MANWRSTINANNGEDIEDPGKETTSFYLLRDFTLFINGTVLGIIASSSKSPVIETAINLKARFSLCLSHFKISL